MSKEDFETIMNFLNGAYKDFELYENRMNAFFTFLRNYEPRIVWRACQQYIYENRYAPSIHDLMQHIERVQNEQDSGD